MDGLEAGKAAVTRLLVACDTLQHYDDWRALDARDAALGELAALGVGYHALAWMARISATEATRIGRRARSPGTNTRRMLTARLRVIAAGSPLAPPPTD
ncbi:MAG TPA: hypothetical protein VGM91_19360 [Conexibacter sp.]|jgi:hypothetical protein